MPDLPLAIIKHPIITGGPGKHSAFIPTFGTSKSVTRKIQTPG